MKWQLEVDADRKMCYIKIPTRTNDAGQHVPHTMVTQKFDEAEMIVDLVNGYGNIKEVLDSLTNTEWWWKKLPKDGKPGEMKNIQEVINFINEKRGVL